jgi:hypothetical protein
VPDTTYERVLCKKYLSNVQVMCVREAHEEGRVDLTLPLPLSLAVLLVLMARADTAPEYSGPPLAL